MAFKLYVDKNFSSPYAMSAYVALVEKLLPFAVQTVDLDAGEARQPPFRDLGLTARVPVLVHTEAGREPLVLAESSAIIEYLDDVCPAPQRPPLLPADPRQRARARQIQAWLRSDLAALRDERSTLTIFFAPASAPLSGAGQAAAALLVRVAEQLVDGPHLFGAWCIADTELALMLNRLILNGDPVPQPLKDYAAAQWRRESVLAWRQQGRG